MTHLLKVFIHRYITYYVISCICYFSGTSEQSISAQLEPVSLTPNVMKVITMPSTLTQGLSAFSLSLTLAGSALVANTQPTTLSQCTLENIYERAEAFEQAVAAGDIEAATEVYAPMGTLVPPQGSPISGSENIAKLQARILKAGITRIEHDIDSVELFGTRSAIERGEHASFIGDKQVGGGDYIWQWVCLNDKWHVLVDTWTSR